MIEIEGADAAMPAGPWLMVMGMHRSGTSAVTGALGRMGLAVPRPDDRLDEHESNPEHFESRAILRFNMDLLQLLGGSWDGPPDLEGAWHERAEVRALDSKARAAAARAFPGTGPVACKDPRMCLLLPYWRMLIDGPVAAVLIFRSPPAVAASLQKRNGFAMVDGVALWEHYNRAALSVLEGDAVYVDRYESVVDDPPRATGAIASWLDGLPQFEQWRGTWDVAAAADGVASEHRHQAASEDWPLLDSQRELLSVLDGLVGPHTAFPAPDLPPPSPWSTGVLELHRDAYRRLKAERELEQLRNSAGYRLTRPFRTLRSRPGRTDRPS